MDWSYLNFDLRIDEAGPDDYRVAVVSSPLGETTGAFRVPFSDLEKELLRLENAMLRSGPQTPPRRRLFSGQEPEAQAFGQKLFDALFSIDIRSLYDQSRQAAGNRGLRLRLRINNPKLAAIPWEFLYDPRGAGGFIALNLNTPLVRYLETPYPPKDVRLRQNEPICILGMSAAPENQIRLDVEKERENLEKAVKNLPNIRLSWVEGETWRHLSEALDSGQWHVFHFIGHGLFDPDKKEGMIVLCDERRREHKLSATELAELIADHYTLRFVFLNSCEGAKSDADDLYSSTASILVGNGIPAVLAMQYEIYDRSAVEFSRTLYGALAKGDPVDKAVIKGRKAIKIGTQNVMEWGTPVLTMRSPNGVLFRPETALESEAREEAELQARLKPEHDAEEKADHEEAGRQVQIMTEQKTKEKVKHEQRKNADREEAQHQVVHIAEQGTVHVVSDKTVRFLTCLGYFVIFVFVSVNLLKSRFIAQQEEVRRANLQSDVGIATSTLLAGATSIPLDASNTVWMPVERNFDGVIMLLVPAGCFMMGNGDSDNTTVIASQR